MAVITVEGNEYVVRRFPADDRRPRTEANLRAMRREYAAYLPGGDLYGKTPLEQDAKGHADGVYKAARKLAAVIEATERHPAVPKPEYTWLRHEDHVERDPFDAIIEAMGDD